jgi:hypothetical protein
MRAERLRLSTPRRPEPAANTREISVGSKKRKANDGEDESRKRTRPVVDVPGGFFDETIETNSRNVKSPNEEVTPSPAPTPADDLPQNTTTTTLPSHPVSAPAKDAAIDEDEWAAFERDVATPPPDPSLPPAFTAEATISAAPLTAAEIAAQSREQASMQAKEKREAEVEGEKEDAARALEEEFDEMEGLEERVARLRRMREELRNRKARLVDGEGEDDDVGETLDGRGGMVDDGGDEDESDEEEEGEDLYGWGNLGR